MTPAKTTDGRQPETKADAEALIPQFSFERVLNQDQGGRRITLLGAIKALPALLTLERAAFPSNTVILNNFLANLSNTTNLGANDVYRWYMSNHTPSPLSEAKSASDQKNQDSASEGSVPDLKLNLIYPCTLQHIKKYTSQRLRYITESPQVYATHIKPWVERTQRTPARLDWIYNILDGITEQEDVIYRTPEDFDVQFQSSSSLADPKADIPSKKGGFMLLPDLNWDRKTVEGLHLLAVVQRRDLWSLRELKKSDLAWLKTVRNIAVKEAAKHGRKLLKNQQKDGDIDEDMLKCYVHYQPTYYHFHIHIVHVMLEAEGTTQSVGKAFALENLISQLEHITPSIDATDRDPGMHQVDLSYFVGEESDLWKKCFSRIKRGEHVDLNE